MFIETAWEIFQRLEYYYKDIFYNKLREKIDSGYTDHILTALIKYKESRAIEILKNTEEELILQPKVNNKI
jgi:hypothetical protein